MKEIDQPYYELDAEELFSKWGFGDGDALDDWWWDNYGEDAPFDSDEALFSLVVVYLVPELRKAGHDVDVYRISTLHNPVRSDTLNGEEIDLYALRPYGELVVDPPVSVKVTKQQILGLLDKLIIKENTDGTRRSAPDRSPA